MDSKREVLVKFGKRVREIRNEMGISQEQLAFEADLHRTHIGMIERAEKNITLVNIQKIYYWDQYFVKILFVCFYHFLPML